MIARSETSARPRGSIQTTHTGDRARGSCTARSTIRRCGPGFRRRAQSLPNLSTRRCWPGVGLRRYGMSIENVATETLSASSSLVIGAAIRRSRLCWLLPCRSIAAAQARSGNIVSAVRHKACSRLWTASILSGVAYMTALTACGWVAFDLHYHSSPVGLVVFASFLPSLIITPSPVSSSTATPADDVASESGRNLNELECRSPQNQNRSEAEGEEVCGRPRLRATRTGPTQRARPISRSPVVTMSEEICPT